jgi:hypothetical protein
MKADEIARALVDEYVDVPLGDECVDDAAEAIARVLRNVAAEMRERCAVLVEELACTHPDGDEVNVPLNAGYRCSAAIRALPLEEPS